jgi:hypothetical protein
MTIVTVLPRPETIAPPAHLGEDERKLWIAVMGSMGADWFPPETRVLLEQYCRMHVRARLLAAMIEASTNADVRARLVRDELKTTKSILGLAVKMRIAQQSTYDRARIKRKPVNVPWDDED